MTEDPTRRDLLKLGAAATVAASIDVGDALAAPAPQTAATTFFTPDERALVDELSEMIIPADEHSPGARAAKVADFIDARLAEAFEEKDRAAWRNGLQLVESLSREMHGRTFMQLSPAEQVAVLTRMAQNERRPEKPEEIFFGEPKARVVRAYYTSEIGIKREMEYKGNTYLAQFAGVDVS